MTHVLVTGGAGFIGSHIVDHLVTEGYDVTVLDNLTDQVHDEEPDYLNEDAEYVWGDIRNRDLVEELLADADVLNHQASAVSVAQSMHQIAEYTDVNTLGTARLLDVVVNENIELEKVVLASSYALYGEGAYYCPACDEGRHPDHRRETAVAQGIWEQYCEECGEQLESRPTPETKPPETTSVYAVTKRDQEEMSLVVGDAYDIPVVALRYFNVYGSRQSLDNPYTGVCAIFSSRIKNGNPPIVYEDGNQCRDFVHVRDVARANQCAIESTASNEIVNVGTGRPTSITEIAETLIDLYGADTAPEITGEFRQGDIRHCYADTTKAANLLEFEAERELQEGMAELVAWGQNLDATDNFEEVQAELEQRGLVGEEQGK